MKKLLFFAAMMLGLASCQTEPEGLDVNVGGEQLVTVNVTVPETETRANAGSDSAGTFRRKHIHTHRTQAPRHEGKRRRYHRELPTSFSDHTSSRDILYILQGQ